MIICGLKLTHDGSIAVINNGQLDFCIEMEKIKNNPRFQSIEDAELIKEILNDNGYSLSQIDKFVIDGWGGYNEDALAVQPRLQLGENNNKLSINNLGEEYFLDVAQYRERTIKSDILEEFEFSGLKIGNESFKYSSFLHSAGHILSAYCTSPFAQKDEDSYILVWDGGMYPRLYYFDVANSTIENLGPIFLLIGNIYTIFSQHFGPFKVNGKFAKDSLSIAGKVMAYIALGECKTELLNIFDEIILNSYNNPMGFANLFANEVKTRINGKYSDEDILMTFHVYLENLLINKLMKKIRLNRRKNTNLCISGGCGLNIKWNSAIRNNDFFDNVYVPPFPNDSGSAIGIACCGMLKLAGNHKLNWSVYSGSKIIPNEPKAGWIKRDCNLKELSKLLYETNEPVVFLNGRAELGPRALGNRSILASPTSKMMKDLLNDIKIREDYRPVSPICIEEKASEIFEPGTFDPYMLFDHEVKNNWIDKIPAVIHLDNTARLQTIGKDQNPVVYELLQEFYMMTNIPLLCNTSANLKGRGFFPDVLSATDWGKVNYVWSDNTLYEKADKNIYELN